VTGRLGWLIGLSLALWVVVAVPSRWLWGDAAAVYSGVALLLCLAPTALTLVWSDWAFRQSAVQQLVVVLGGTGVRMAFVLAAAWALVTWVPYFQLQPGFWAWVLGAYLATLALETVLMVRGRSVTVLMVRGRSGEGNHGA
jgi:hypothetical protein